MENRGASVILNERDLEFIQEALVRVYCDSMQECIATCEQARSEKKVDRQGADRLIESFRNNIDTAIGVRERVRAQLHALRLHDR